MLNIQTHVYVTGMRHIHFKDFIYRVCWFDGSSIFSTKMVNEKICFGNCLDRLIEVFLFFGSKSLKNWSKKFKIEFNREEIIL